MKYERVTSIVKIEKMEALTASESIKAQIKIYKLLPANFRRSATLDNGLEHVKHTKLQSLEIKTYFAEMQIFGLNITFPRALTLVKSQLKN